MDWKFKKDIPPQGSSDGFWYDITDGGYIRPKEILGDEEQLKILNEALRIVSNFEWTIKSKGILEQF